MTRTEEILRFGVQIASEAIPGPFTGNLASGLIDIMAEARAIGRINVAESNRKLTPREIRRRELGRIRVEGFVKSLGWGAEFGNDPRGAAVRLILPSGRSNSFGGVGWVVPV